MSVLRVHADFNGLVSGPRDSSRTGVVLDTLGALRDLCNAATVLQEGTALIAFDASDDVTDLEGHGTAYFDAERGAWIVEFDEIGVRTVPASSRNLDARFLCVACRADLTSQIAQRGLRLGDACALCGCLVHTPVGPPAPGPPLAG